MSINQQVAAGICYLCFTLVNGNKLMIFSSIAVIILSCKLKYSSMSVDYAHVSSPCHTDFSTQESLSTCNTLGLP